MSATYQCLSCGLSLPESEVGAAGMVAPCPKCGRDMYREEPRPAAVPSRYGGAAPAVGGAGLTRSAPAIPSRYGGAAGGDQYVRSRFEDDEGDNPYLKKHTPSLVYIALVFSLLPLGCFFGVIASYMAYRLVVDGPEGTRGKEVAIAGMIIGGLMSVLSVYLIVVLKQ
jgi:hypothetical protein